MAARFYTVRLSANLTTNHLLSMKAYLEAQATKCGGADVSEFVVSVLEAHQQRQVRSQVEPMLLERIDGPFEEWTDQDMEDIRKEGTAMINLRKGK